MQFPDEFNFTALNKFLNNKLIIWYNEYDDTSEIYSYGDVINFSMKIQEILTKLDAARGDRIAIQFDHCVHIIPVILSILNINCPFCPISTSVKDHEIVEYLKRYEAKFLITSRNFDQMNLQEIFTAFKSELYFYKINLDIRPFSYNFCYVIQTSGSTGEPKIVKVPYECIMPNVKCLSSLYKITSDDVIFVFAPSTFDPFILDVFLALKNGAALFMVPKHIRFNSKRLDKILSSHNFQITIMQMTPSILRILNLDLFNNSKLRILTLGGESISLLDVPKLKRLLNATNKKLRIFNIYGITEISCWSTIQEITNDTQLITLGKPFDNETFLQIRNLEENSTVITKSNDIGELCIGSKTRKCLLDNENSEILHSYDEILYRPTGDLVFYTKEKEIIFKGRKNEIIKRYGHRINLRKIEETIKQIKVEEITNAHCIFIENDNKLILFLKLKIQNLINRTEWFSILRENLDTNEIPDDIILVDKFPLSHHDKISKRKLIEIYKNYKLENLKEHQNANIVKIFKNWIIEILGIKQNEKHLKFSWDSVSFLSLGGTSFQALNLVTKLENVTKASHSDILEMLLKPNCYLDEIFSKLKSFKESSFTKSDLSDDSKHKTVINQKYSMKILWKYETRKCIDANPTLINLLNKGKIISVGSHSHLLVNINADKGTAISSLELPDRIEGQVAFVSDNYGVVGCYDGHLYKFDINTGKIIWKFNSNGMIKNKPLVSDNYVIFGNYANEKNLFCLNMDSRTEIWSIKFGTKGILSSPIKVDNETFVIGTLDGTFGRIELKTGNVVWTLNLNQTPIFSTPSKLCKNNFILSGVNGLICCFDLLGNELWKFKANGTVFSSFEIVQNKNENIYIFFGCHDHNIYCLEYYGDKTISLKWKKQLQSQIYSTPRLILLGNVFYVVVCSTSGFINILNIDIGELLINVKINGEIFSSPAINDNQIFVGCRDNNLYAIELKQN